jgi:AGCS family alanine or glycine:cation symporter
MNQAKLLEIVSILNQDYVGPLLAVILLGTGLYFTFRLRFIQRYYLRAFKLLFSGKGKASKKEGMSPFQALSTAIASQVGTGNIVGVSTAIVAGGPGAIFWLWVTTLLGMSTNFAEAVLGQLYRNQKDGHVVGGPAYYIRDGLKSRWLAGVFSIFLILALGVTGIMVQANSIINASTRILPADTNPFYIGIVLALLVGVVLAGGITRIASFAERIVPFMAALFVGGSLVFVAMNLSAVPGIFGDIFRHAFTPWAPAGGVLGATVMMSIRYGVARGLFSNEAGMGSTPHAHALANVDHPHEQGLVALIGIAVDLVICTCTALVILLTGVLFEHPEAQGVNVMQYAFGTVFGRAGDWFTGIMLFFFSFTTIVSWYFFAAQNVRFLFGERLVRPYIGFIVVVILVASVAEVELVWELADTFNCLLVIPNVIALLWLSPEVVREVKLMRGAKEEK